LIKRITFEGFDLIGQCLELTIGYIKGQSLCYDLGVTRSCQAFGMNTTMK